MAEEDFTYRRQTFRKDNVVRTPSAVNIDFSLITIAGSIKIVLIINVSSGVSLGVGAGRVLCEDVVCFGTEGTM